MLIKLKIINVFGEFESDKLEVNEEQYQELIKMSKTFWLSSEGFDIWTEEGGSIIFPPSIIQNSILVIKIIEK